MIRKLQQELATLVQAAAMKQFGLAPERIAFSRPPKIEMGDLATPCALELGKRLGKKPREVAEPLAAALAGKHRWVERIEIAGPGYLNFHLDKKKVAEFLVANPSPIAPAPTRGKVIVEHTNINPNKAAHIGHLRNSVLGDTLGRVLRALGERAEIQNYIDDTGVQVADVVVGLLHKEGKSPAEAIAWIETEPKTLDKRCWDLYASVTTWYAADPAREQFRRDALHAIEHGAGDAHRVAAALVPGILRCHLATMARLGITYEVLTHESVIIALGFFKTAFEAMRRLEVVHLETTGKNEGCWTMRLKDDPEFAGMEDADKVIVRSNGTVTYVGKDVAYQMWKLGLLGADFHYGKFKDFAGVEIAQTKPQIETKEFEGRFGHGDTVINVIDNRQSYLQKVIGVGLRKLGHADAAARSIHFNYEMVGLSPQTATDLGAELSQEDKKKKFIEMSGRSGLGMKADDLLDLAIHRPLMKIATKQKEPNTLSEEAQQLVVHCIELARLYREIYVNDKSSLESYHFKMIRRSLESLEISYYADIENAEPKNCLDDFVNIFDQTHIIVDRGAQAALPIGVSVFLGKREAYEQAKAIGLSGVKYYLLRYTKDQVIGFDVTQATDVEGETGPYLLYTAVRARNILRKYAEAGKLDEAAALKTIDGWGGETLAGWEPEAQALAMDLMEIPKVADAAVTTLELSLLAKHFFTMAQGFNNWYHKHPVLKEGIAPADRDRRLRFVRLFERHFRGALETMLGLPVPERM